MHHYWARCHVLSPDIMCPRHTWIRQLEIDVGLTAAAAWDMAGDREVWRAQRPVAGQAVQ